MSRVSSSELLAALDQRVAAVAKVLEVVDGSDFEGAPPGAKASQLLPQIIDRCRNSSSLETTWLVMSCVTARLPWADDVRQMHRLIRRTSTTDVVTQMLGDVIANRHHGQPQLELDVVENGVVVDVDFCARHDYNSGIQRVVRRTLPRWAEAGRRFVPTAWVQSRDAARTLGAQEWQRVFSHKHTEAEDQAAPREVAAEPTRLIVPWRSTLVLVEVPVGSVCQSIACLAELSGNEVACIGYDAIPVVNADLRPAEETDAFATYLSMIKHADRVVGISRTSAAEFQGFADALTAQGLPGPDVIAVAIPDDGVAPSDSTPVRRRDGSVHVLLAGAREPHKNHRAVLHAAERLWRENLQFDLTLVGGRGWHSTDLDEYVAELAGSGRPIRSLGRVSDEELDAIYRDADVVVFASLQEGFGLPAAEALAVGTPVLTSSFGSLAEIAAGGGALVADPRVDDDLAARLRELVVDVDLRERLAREALERPVRTWDEYADEAWRALVRGGS